MKQKHWKSHTQQTVHSLKNKAPICQSLCTAQGTIGCINDLPKSQKMGGESSLLLLKMAAVAASTKFRCSRSAQRGVAVTVRKWIVSRFAARWRALRSLNFWRDKRFSSKLRYYLLESLAKMINCCFLPVFIYFSSANIRTSHNRHIQVSLPNNSSLGIKAMEYF